MCKPCLEDHYHQTAGSCPNAGKFLQNRDCPCFPCHENIDEVDFSCLFCYCPLYALGETCGGNYLLTETGIKDCSLCIIPHLVENYDHITCESEKLILKVQSEMTSQHDSGGKNDDCN